MYTVWWVIFGRAKFHEKSKSAFRINFCDCHPNDPLDHFQIEVRSEELANCCSNSIDARYSSLLLRCEGEIRFIQTMRFLLASSDKLHFFSEDARSSRRALESRTSSVCPTFMDEVGHTRLHHQLVDISKKGTPEPYELGSYAVDHDHQVQGPLVLVRVRIRVGINFRGWKFS